MDAQGPFPIVLVPSCNRQVGLHPFHVVGQKYVDAVRLAGCLPLVAPASKPAELDQLLDLVDGVFLTGSPSNVHPDHYGEPVHNPALPLDRARDSFTLSLIPQALARGIPLFAICRGFQEMNVALGGDLHQAVQEQPGLHDHRANDDEPIEQQYAVSHSVSVQEGGVLDRLLGPGQIEVNSLHGQGVRRLAPGLHVEARAPDGLVEAFSQPQSLAFNLAVQWHPEWLAHDNPVSMKLLRAFGSACQHYRERARQTLQEHPRDAG